ncbi:MAG: hypothetical protein ABIP09_05060 [Gemmatimonadaceae bacterium]
MVGDRNRYDAFGHGKVIAANLLVRDLGSPSRNPGVAVARDDLTGAGGEENQIIESGGTCLSVPGLRLEPPGSGFVSFRAGWSVAATGDGRECGHTGYDPSHPHRFKSAG